MNRFLHYLVLFIATYATLLASARAQTRTLVPANEAAADVNQYATVEGVVAKVFIGKSGNTFLNIGATYPNQTFTGWIPPASPVSKSPVLSSIEGKHVRITGRIEMYKGNPKFESMPPLSSRLNELLAPILGAVFPHLTEPSDVVCSECR
jgi:hypothetical protein